MFGDDDDHSRRRLLQLMAGTGIVGAGAGAATGAYLTDGEAFADNVVGTDEFTLELATVTEDDDTLDDFSEGTALSVDFPELEPGDEGLVRTGYRLCEAPGRVWMRTDAAGDADLADDIDIRIHRSTCDEGLLDELFTGTLAELSNHDLDRGVRLGEDCVGCDPSCLDLQWGFETETPDVVSEKSVSLRIEFVAVQCRHDDEANPWQ